MPGKRGFEQDSSYPQGKDSTKANSSFKPHESTTKLNIENNLQDVSKTAHTTAELEWAKQQLADARKSGLLAGDQAITTNTGDRRADTTNLPDSLKKSTIHEKRISERNYRLYDDNKIRARL